MKNTLIIIFVFILSVLGFTQKPCEDRIDSVKVVTLNEAKLMSELINKYPTTEYNATIDYVSVEISTSSNGKHQTAIGTSDELTTEQKNILKTADIGSRIKIKIKFKYKDPKNDNLGSGRKIKEMEYQVKASTLAPSGLPPCGC
jgi:hypothetical protein